LTLLSIEKIYHFRKFQDTTVSKLYSTNSATWKSLFNTTKANQKICQQQKLMNELIQNIIVAILIPPRHKRGKKTQKVTNYSENIDFEMNPKNYNTYHKVFIH
jgi:hypothetical protein